MNTSQIETILSSYKNYKGTFACDELPTKCENGLYVCNTDPKDKPGQHWIAFYISNDHCEYFDSYGLRPFIHEIKTFIEENVEKITYNSKCLQGANSHVCGHYVIFFAMCKMCGLSLRNILSLFSKTSVENDASMYTFVCKLLKECI